MTTHTHLEKREYIIPSNLVSKLSDLGLGMSICRWIFDFDRQAPGGENWQTSFPVDLLSEEKFGMKTNILSNFYRCTMKSLLTGCIAVWYGSSFAYSRKSLEREVEVT